MGKNVGVAYNVVGTKKEKENQIDRHSGTQTDTHTDTQTDTQMDTQTNRQTDTSTKDFTQSRKGPPATATATGISPKDPTRATNPKRKR